MQKLINDIKLILQEQEEAHTKYKASITTLEKSPDRSALSVSQEKERIKYNYDAKSEIRRENAVEKLEMMRKKETADIDLTDDRLIFAVELVLALGVLLPVKEYQSIANTFRGDQAALRVLKIAFESKGVTNTGIERLIYEIEPTYKEIKKDLETYFKRSHDTEVLDRVYKALKRLQNVITPTQAQ